MRKTEIILNTPAYLGLSILKLSRMFDFWYGYVKPKYGEIISLYT